MNPLHTDLPVIYLKPGELYLGEQPTMVTTTLGSCVSLVFFNQLQRLGAICHATLPTDDQQEKSFRFVDRAFFWMLEQFQSRNIIPKQIQVKLFGGADVLESSQGCSHPVTVGQRNIHQALKLVRAHGLQVQVSNLGGNRGRKIFFFTHSGVVLLKKVGKISRWDQSIRRFNNHNP